jgi:hypothetical protein
MSRRKCVLVAGVTAVALSVGAAEAAAEARGGGGAGSAALCQRGGYTNLYNARTGARFTDEVACVSYGLNGNPYSSLVVTVNRACRGTCWGSVSGFGLKPGAPVRAGATAGLLPNPGLVDRRGTISGLLGLDCGYGWSGVYATSRTSAGAPIRSNAVDSPCG